MRALLGILAAAVAAGLSAHILAGSFAHHASLTDLAVLLAAICCVRIAGHPIRGSQNVLRIAMGAAVIAVAWPYVEPDAHGRALEALISLLWLLPVMLTLLCSILSCARHSVKLVRALAALAKPRLRVAAPVLARTRRERCFTVVDAMRRAACRRGPPALVLSTNSTT